MCAFINVAHGKLPLNVIAFSSNYTLYGDISRRVMQTLSEFTPNMEIYSIDEAFLDFSGFNKKELPEYIRHHYCPVQISKERKLKPLRVASYPGQISHKSF